MKALLFIFLLNTSVLHIEQDDQLDSWVQKIVLDLIEMNDLGKYSDKAIPNDVTVNFLMVESVKDIKYDDSHITMLINHGTGKYCTELKFEYLERKGEYFLVFSEISTTKVFGKEQKFIDP